MVVNGKTHKRPEMAAQEIPRGRANGCRVRGRGQSVSRAGQLRSVFADSGAKGWTMPV